MDQADGHGDILLKEDFRLGHASFRWDTVVDAPPKPPLTPPHTSRDRITPLHSDEELSANKKMNTERRGIWHRMTSDINKRRLDCEECGYSTFQPAKFKKHVVIHSKVMPFACKQCSYKTKRECNLRRHIMGMHEGIKPYTCQHCDYRSNARGNLKTHQLLKHGINSKKMFICDVCEYSTNNSSSFNVHLRKHTGDEPFTCIECPFKSHDRTTLDAHLRNHDVSLKRQYVCRKCSFRTNNSHSFDSHLIFHPVDLEQEPPVAVQEINENVKSVKGIQYDVHPREKKKRQRIRKKILYQCEECSEVLDGKIAQLAHQKTHGEKVKVRKTKKKLYNCVECEVVSVGRVAFTEHKRIHIQNLEIPKKKKKLYSCKQCEVVSEGKTAYLKHRSTHSKGSKMKLYSCGKCTVISSGIAAFTEHRRTHKKPLNLYNCDRCDVVSIGHYAFTNHQRTHKWEQRDQSYFHCKQCPFVASEEHFLKKHLGTCGQEFEAPNLEGCRPAVKELGCKEPNACIPAARAIKPVFACLDCDFTTPDKSLLRIHEDQCDNHLLVNAVFDQIIEVRDNVFTEGEPESEEVMIKTEVLSPARVDDDI